MKNSVFGELVFNTGWKTNKDVQIFGRIYSITIKAKAYYEADGITNEQEKAFSNFADNEANQINHIEKMLIALASSNAQSRFIPRTLLFLRDGGYAMLLDDKEDEDGGIAACLAPKAEIISQDEYL
jgi:hypothetical protein